MPDPVPLLNAVERLADRFRAMPRSRLTGASAGTTGSRAAEGLALAGRLAEAARRLESPDTPPRRMPDAGVFAVGDQIAVAGHDLASAVHGRPDGDPEAAVAVVAALRDLGATAGHL